MAYEQNDQLGTATVPQNAGRVANERDDAQSASIERDIDRTRGRLDSTVDTLVDRLRPSSLIDDVMDYFASDDGGRTQSPRKEKVRRVAKRAGGGLWDRVTANPVPSALIGAGIAYLFLKGDDLDEDVHEGSADMRRRIERNNREPRMYGGSYVDARTGKPYDEENYGEGYERATGRGGSSSSGSSSGGPGVVDRLKEYAGDAVDGVKSAAGYVADKASDAAGAISGAASSAGSAVSDAAGRTRSALGDAASRTGDAASSTGGATGRYAGDAWHKTQRGYAVSRDRIDDAMHEKPLVVGIAALAAGLLAGLAVPRTRYENELVGEYSGDLKNRAGDLAGEAWDRGKTVYEKGLSAAQETARQEGVEPGSLADDASGVVSHAAQSLGKIAEAAVGGLKDTAHDVAEVAKGEAQDVKSDAQDKGLTPANLVEQGKQVAQATTQAVKDEGQKQVDDAKSAHDVQS